MEQFELAVKFGLKVLIVLGLIVGVMMFSISRSDLSADAPDPPAETQNRTQEDIIKEQFSGWDGSHPALVKHVKSTMADPRSFEHLETRYSEIDNNTLYIMMKYSGNNAYGGRVIGYIQADVNYSGHIIKVY